MTMFITVCVGFLAGTLGGLLTQPLFLSFLVSLVLLAAFLMRGSYPYLLRPVLLFCLALILGYFRAQWTQNSFEEQKARFNRPVTGQFHLWIGEDPEVLFERFPGGHTTGRSGGFYQPFVREVRAVCVMDDPKENGPIKVRCSFRLSPESATPILSYGDTVEVEGKILAPPGAMNPGQFDYAHYLKTKGIPAVMYLQPGRWKKLDQAPVKGWAFRRWSYGLKRGVEDSIYRLLAFPQNALLDGILLGVRGPLPGELVESFMETGTVHILAVSGMITAFIAGILFLFFRAVQMPRKAAAMLTLAGLGFFVFMTGAHPPVCRAGLFSALALLAVLVERKVHGGTLLLATAALLVMVDPFVLEDLSFQISFLATAGLMVLAGRFLEKLERLWKPAALLLATTAAAQLSVWCLLIHSFNQLSPYSLLANLLIVPLALFSVAAGLVAVAGSYMNPFLGDVFAAGCDVPLRLLSQLSDKLAGLPGANFIVGSPPESWVLAFHALLLFSFWAYWPSPEPGKPSERWLNRERFMKGCRRTSRFAWGFFLVLSIAGWIQAWAGVQPLRVTILSVGHGNAMVARTPDGKVLVFDGGKENHGLDRYNILVAYLRHLGIRRVDAIFNSHPDEDHVGGLVNLVSAYPVREAFEGEGAISDSRIYERFKELLEEKKIPLKQLQAGDRPDDWEPLSLFVLHPAGSFHPKIHPDNNRSMVCWLSFPVGEKKFSMLLPGDLEREGVKELLKKHRPFPKVDCLLAPHHGRESGAQDLCAGGFKPQMVVLSDWMDHPEDHGIYKTQVPQAEILSTAQEGAIELEIGTKRGVRYKTFTEGKWKTFEL